MDICRAFLFHDGSNCESDRECKDCVNCNKNALSFRKMKLLQSKTYIMMKNKVIKNKIGLEAPYHALTNAGHISYVELDGDTTKKNIKNELIKRKDKLNEYIEEYSKAKEEYGEEITLNAHVIMEYADKAWVLYAGNHNNITY